MSTTDDGSKEVEFLLASGSAGSAGEHAVFEQLYNVPAVSTERLLKLANRQGIPIFAIDSNNINEILPKLSTFPV